MNVSRAIVVALAMVVAHSSLPRPCQAADADELIRQGVALRRNGNDAAALQLFQQALQLQESPRAIAQIGLAEQALGRWAMAYTDLNRALEAKDDPWIKKNKPLIDEALNRVNEHVGLLEILGGTAGAEVRIDGSPRGKLPLAHPIPVSTGTVTIDLMASGLIPVQRVTVVRARESVRESFDPLAAAPVRERSAATAGGGAASMDNRAATATASPSLSLDGAPPHVDSTAAGAGGAGDQSQSDQGGGGTSFRPALKWVAWGAGTAALAVGVFGWIRQDKAGNDFSAGCRIDAQQNVVVTPGSTRTESSCRDLKNQVDSNFHLEVGGLVAAGALAAAGLVLWLTEPTPAQRAAASLSCAPGLVPTGGAWVGCRLIF